MGNRRKKQPVSISVKHFTWRFFRRDGVYYADGRTNKYQLGKHSLGTRDREEALARLKLLDQQKAVEHGLISAAALENWTNCTRSPSAFSWFESLQAECSR